MKKGYRNALADLALDDEEESPQWDEEAYADECVQEEEAAAVPHGAEAPQPEAGEAQGGRDDGPDVCAICLNAVELEDLAIVKGCEHAYCVHCILQWAAVKEAAWCPQCKHPFNYLYCHRQLDGTLSDAPVEESVCLLKRATWFVEHVKALEKGVAVSGAMAAADDEVQPEWGDPYYFHDDDAYDEEDEDEQIEKYYFSSAAGAARVVLGNRRMGENGFMRSGRMYARPAGPNSNAGGGASHHHASGGGSIGKAGKGRAGGGKAGEGAAAGAGAGASGSGAGAGSGSGAGPSGSRAGAAAAGPSQAAKAPGRRAKRNARRAAVDYDDDDY